MYRSTCNSVYSQEQSRQFAQVPDYLCFGDICRFAWSYKHDRFSVLKKANSESHQKTIKSVYIKSYMPSFYKLWLLGLQLIRLKAIYICRKFDLQCSVLATLPIFRPRLSTDERGSVHVFRCLLCYSSYISISTLR